MQYVWLTALGVGATTVIGALLGFTIRHTSHKITDITLSFAAGVMLAAAVIGLILPSLDTEKPLSLLMTIIGIFAGALTLHLIDKLVPHQHRPENDGEEQHPKNSAKMNKVMLFVLAIAIHNFPEGVAAGVGFGTDINAALTIAGGIALQNIPEGMAIIAPMRAIGMSRKRTLLYASLTGLVEVVGTFVGYAVSFSAALLPFCLAFAGGTMLYIISDEMIPETHAHGAERAATYALLIGFCLMLATDFFFA